MTDTTANANAAEAPEDCVSMEEGREYLFSRCSSCDSMHKRQKVLRISDADVQKWEEAGRCPNRWRLFLSVWPLWMGIIFMFSVDGNFYPRFGWAVTAIMWTVGLALGIIGYRSNRWQSERKVSTREYILEKYGIFAPLDEIDTLESLKQSDWESEPEDDEKIKYALAAEK